MVHGSWCVVHGSWFMAHIAHRRFYVCLSPFGLPLLLTSPIITFIIRLRLRLLYPPNSTTPHPIFPSSPPLPKPTSIHVRPQRPRRQRLPERVCEWRLPPIQLPRRHQGQRLLRGRRRLAVTGAMGWGRLCLHTCCHPIHHPIHHPQSVADDDVYLMLSPVSCIFPPRCPPATRTSPR